MAEILPHPHANATFFCNAVGPGLLQGNLHFARQFFNSNNNLTMKNGRLENNDDDFFLGIQDSQTVFNFEIRPELQPVKLSTLRSSISSL